MTTETVVASAVELTAAGTGSTVDLGVGVVVGGESGWWTTELHDGVGDTHAFAKGWNADFGFQEVDVEFKEDVTGDFLLYLKRQPQKRIPTRIAKKDRSAYR